MALASLIPRPSFLTDGLGRRLGFSYSNAWSTQQQNVGMGAMWVGHYGCYLRLYLPV